MKRIITDLDGTLLKGSLVLQHALFLESKGIIDTMGTGNAWLKDVKNEKCIVDLAMAYQRGITGKHITELKVKDFIGTITLQDFTSAIEEMKDSYTTIMTGSPSFLVDELVTMLNTDSTKVNAIATIYEVENGTFTGNIIRPAFTGKDKLLKKFFPNEKFDIGMGDTASDIPLLEVSKRKILVNPNVHTLRATAHLKLEIID